MATVSTHITINGVRMPLDRPRTVLAEDTVYFDTVVCADGLRRLANYRKKWDQVRGVVVVGTERGAEAYAMRDFEPTPSGGKIG